MSNAKKLLLMALGFSFLSWLCFESGNTFLIVMGVLFGLIGAFLFIIWVSYLLGIVTSIPATNQRRCPSCQSRHYVVYPRGSKFGFAFPMRFVKVTKTDFHCQSCGTDWSITEADERGADA
ncbi:MAG: hypothetical protein V1668_02265 [Patescibacteria group bacterium]